MLEEWFNFFNQWEKKPETPNDNIRYLVSRSVIEQTEKVLKEYGEIDHSHEGLVYWAGTRNESEILVNAVIAPETISTPGSVTITPESNFYVIQCLSQNKLVHLGQVHSHPGSWVGHSLGDDLRASFKRNGLLSIVVSNYCHHGMLPIKQCGIHRYSRDEFIRLSKKYVQKHFKLTRTESALYDFRK